MSKRKCEDYDRKIEKLERRLAKYKKKMITDEDVEKHLVDEQDPNPEGTTDQHQELAIDISNSDSEDVLDENILSALGESASGEKQYGEKIHVEIFNSIKNILTEGMPKQNKEKLMESLLIPSNCKLFDAPKLNVELMGIINNPSKTRDKLLQDRQQDVGLALASVCQIINSLSKKEFDKLNIVKKLSDVSRVLSNLHYQYTDIRRKLINPMLDKNLSENLKNNKRDDFLYSDLDESIKSFSAIKRATSIIKPKQPTQQKPSTSTKNYQQPPRRLNPNQAPPVRGSSRGGIQQRYQPRQPFKPLAPANRGRARYP